jgi:hypothetical protein
MECNWFTITLKLQLITQVSASDSDEHELLVQGLCAFLLGICCMYNDDQNETFSRYVIILKILYII